MTQENKYLLLQDICGRLPYGIKGIRIYKPEETITLAEIIPRCKMNPNVGNGLFCELGFDETPDCCVITEFKSYLRSMSSMTEEEINYLARLLDYKVPEDIKIDGFYTTMVVGKFIDSKLERLINFLNEHHFDYRSLIEKGLAIEAPEGMYKTN